MKLTGEHGKYTGFHVAAVGVTEPFHSLLKVFVKQRTQSLSVIAMQ